MYETGSGCHTCDSKCATCAGDQSYCTSCKSTHKNLLPAPKCICGDGTFDDGTACTACDPKCATCSGSASNCLTCLSKY